MAKLELCEHGLSQLVDAFYAKVRADEMIGPLFNEAIGDWSEHLEKLAAFWSSVMLATGRYKGQPVPAHAKHRDAISPEMFERWLVLWGEVTTALMEPGPAAALQDKAARIAESLQLALFFRLEGQPGHRPVSGSGAPLVLRGVN